MCDTYDLRPSAHILDVPLHTKKESHNIYLRLPLSLSRKL
jgi:hypothetical protein